MEYFAKDPIRSIQSMIKKSIQYYKMKTICQAMSKTIKSAIKEAVYLYVNYHSDIAGKIKDRPQFAQFKIIAEYNYSCQKGYLSLAALEAVNLWLQKYKSM